MPRHSLLPDPIHEQDGVPKLLKCLQHLLPSLHPPGFHDALRSIHASFCISSVRIGRIFKRQSLGGTESFLRKVAHWLFSIDDVLALCQRSHVLGSSAPLLQHLFRLQCYDLRQRHVLHHLQWLQLSTEESQRYRLEYCGKTPAGQESDICLNNHLNQSDASA